MQGHLKLAIFCLILALVWVSHYVFSTEKDAVNIGLFDRSLSVRKLVSCMEISPGHRCLSQFRSGMVSELFGKRMCADVHSLNRCLIAAQRAKSELTMVLQMAECVYTAENNLVGREPAPDQGGSYWVITLGLLLFVLIVPLSRMFIDIEQHGQSEGKLGQLVEELGDLKGLDDDQPQSATGLGQPAPEDALIVNLNGEVYDLHKTEDLERWKRRFNRPPADQTWHESLVIDLASPLEESLESSASTPPPSICTVPEQAQEPTSVVECSDMNSPRMPEPSVLSHPLVGKNGKRLRRVFIPGRGWVHAKLLDLEREALLSLLEH